MSKVRNILFIMADQLRWDYLSCYGHPHLKTPNIDGLAKKGVLFESAYVQSPVCGPSRASYYTGRTVFSHGSTWNQVPLPIGELTIGDYLGKSGIRTGIVGKTHMQPDADGMTRLGINKNTEIGLVVSEPGFEPYERDDGLHPNTHVKKYKKKILVGIHVRSKGLLPSGEKFITVAKKVQKHKPIGIMASCVSFEDLNEVMKDAKKLKVPF